ncbi:hypothetical protein ACIRD3_05630 [Kitasatospora sp. NPDC093550]|uniref:hypothetical protein n=1 Tax=Kitasatospora sp. NPDC093550 TaxID=3364089 RepID=UPI003810E461
MVEIVVLLAGLVSAVVCAVVFLVRRDGARSSDVSDPAGALIERRRTTQTSHLRGTYSSAAVHHGTGMASDDLHRYYS